MDLSSLLATDKIFADVAAVPFLINVVLAAGLSWVLAKHYRRFSRSASDRVRFSRSFLPVAISVLLLIAVVKTSLALSLGLVGALSIVRFRTPVKEVEDIVYLFIAIAIGLGFGAEQRLITLLGVGMLLGLMALRGSSHTAMRLRTLLEIHVPTPANSSAMTGAAILATVASQGTVDLRRMDCLVDAVVVAVAVEVAEAAHAAALVARIQETHPGASVTVIDRDLA